MDQNAPFPITLVKVSDLSHVPTPAVGTTPEPGRLRGQRGNQEKGEIEAIQAKPEASTALADQSSSIS